jgi:peptide/nickel transport system substrate-binding protein
VRYSVVHPVIVMLVSLLMACAGPQAAPVTSGGTAAEPAKPAAEKASILRIALSDDPPSFASRLGGFNGRVNQLINAFLARTDGLGAYGPYLTEKLPSQADGTWVVNPDGTMQTIWTLRADAKWHDGQPVTAADVVFADQIYRDPALPVEPSGSSRSEGFISSVVARDARTFEVNWKQPRLAAGQPTEGDMVPLPRHLLEERYLNGEKQAFALGNFWVTEEYVGAGPYRVSKRDPGISFTLAANPHFFLGKPKIETIEMLIVSDRNAIVARLLSGDVDFSEVIGPEQAVVLRDQWKSNREGQVYTALNKYTSVIFQQREVPRLQTALRDVRVRRALVHAIDREEIANVATNGLAPPAVVSLTPGHPWFARMEAAAGKYPFDLRRTEQLLNEAGWTRGGDGQYRNAGQLFDLEMYGDSAQATIQLALVDYWKRAGLNAIPSAPVAEAVTSIESIMADASFAGGAIETKGPLMYADTSAGQFPTEQNRWTGKNRSSWSHPDYEALNTRFERSLLATEREELVVELERILTSDVGMARVHYNPEPAAARIHVQGIKGKSQGNGPTYIWNISEWTLQ